MGIIYILKKVNVIINRYDFYKTPNEVQREFLKTLKEPKNLIENSFFQYKCQCRLRTTLAKVISNLTAIAILPLILLRYSFKTKKHNTLLKSDNICTYDFLLDGYLPYSVVESHNKIYSIENINGVFSFKDIKLIMSICMKYFLHPYFILKCVMKIFQYSEAIEIYKPKILFASAEYSFTSSILTYYCRLRGVKHINIMHGEKIFDISDAFATFDECYVWDDYYKNLFCKLRSGTKNYHIYRPKFIFPKKQNSENTNIDFKIYLADITRDEIKTLGKIVYELQNEHKFVKVRYHPRFNVRNELLEYLKETQIENPTEVTLLESLLETKYVVSEYSTVLNQAYSMGKNIIVDDITNPLRYIELKKSKYIMLEKEHELLSQILTMEN